MLLAGVGKLPRRHGSWEGAPTPPTPHASPLQHSWRHLYGCRSSHHANTTAANCAQDLTRNLAIGRDTNNYAYAASPTNSTRRQQPRAPREQARTRRQQPGALTTTSTGRDRGSYAEAPPTTTQTMRHKLCEQSRGRSFAQAQRSGRITTGLEEPRDERSRRGWGVPSPGPYPLGSFPTAASNISWRAPSGQAECDAAWSGAGTPQPLREIAGTLLRIANKRRLADNPQHGRAADEHEAEGAGPQSRQEQVRDDRRDRCGPGGRALVLRGGGRRGHRGQDHLRLRHGGQRRHLWPGPEVRQSPAPPGHARVRVQAAPRGARCRARGDHHLLRLR